MTGETLDDTDDERLRQALARLLLDDLGYQRSELQVRRDLPIDTGSHAATSRVDFVVVIDEKALMVVRYSAGALVVRERPTVCVARLLEPHVIPRAVITNGRDARVLDASTGEVVGTGLQAIPDRAALVELAGSVELSALPAGRRAGEERILLAFDNLDEACGCGPTLEH